MQTASKALGIIFIGLLALFLFGLIELFQMRFRAGDVYPPYSSLRTDPLGTKAYYDALGDMPDLSVDRNYKPLPKLEGTSSLLLLGVNMTAIDAIEEKEVKVLESFVLKGGRLVMTFRPARLEQPKKKIEDNEQTKPAEKKPLLSLAERWGFHFVSAGSCGKATLSTDRYQLPQNISWHSPISFDDLAEEWESIYTLEDKPVVIEKRYGKGTVVLATDTYFASNEAVLRERHPEFLAWLVGPYKSIIFDETHLGIFENPSLASLFRKYRLHGVFGGFLVLAALFVWKNILPLVPARSDAERDDTMTTGKDYLSGFISLLRRNIPLRDVLAVSVQEWKKGLRKDSISKEKIERIEKAAEALRDKSIKKELQVNAYRFINKILSERMTHGK